MASSWTWTVVSLLAVVVGVLCQNCPQVAQQFQQQCQGFGCFIPECDGMFFDPVQCVGSVCHCVPATVLEPIGSYAFHIGQAGNTDCRCARQEHSSGTNLNCDWDGSYMQHVVS